MSSIKPHVADAYFDKRIRILTLYVEIVLGAIGGAGVLIWLWYNRRRRSRFNAIILHVTVSDLLVICYASALQLVWEHVDREWRAGDVMCRLLKWGQSFALMSSNYMLVVLSVDRHQAIRAPLKLQLSVTKMTSLGWGIAGILSLPQLAVFGENFVTAEGPFQNKTVCESIFRSRPMSHRQAYLTFISLVVFYIPLCIILILYVRIFLKIAQKTAEASASSGGGTSSSLSPRKFKFSSTWKRRASSNPHAIHGQHAKRLHLHVSTMSRSLPKAKEKTFTLTLVIVSSFILSGLPYHVYELILSFGDHTTVDGFTAAVIGALAIANAVTNPYVFLAFNVNLACVNRMIESLTNREKNGRATRGTQDLKQSSVGTEFTGTAHPNGGDFNVPRGSEYDDVQVVDNKCLTVRAALHAEYHSY